VAPRFTLALTKASIDAAELSAIIACVAARADCVAIDHLDGPDDEDFAGIAGLEEGIALAKGNAYRLRRPLQGIAIPGRQSTGAVSVSAATRSCK
jgi:hypothetical protein